MRYNINKNGEAIITMLEIAEPENLYQYSTYIHLRHRDSAVCTPGFLEFPTISHYFQHRPAITKPRRIADHAGHEILKQ
jgi:hypothetical protein